MIHPLNPKRTCRDCQLEKPITDFRLSDRPAARRKLPIYAAGVYCNDCLVRYHRPKQALATRHLRQLP